MMTTHSCAAFGRGTVRARVLVMVLAASLLPCALAQTVTTRWGGEASVAYREGFARQVRMGPGGGVTLWDRALIENDSPGAGWSQEGVHTDAIWGTISGRKVLELQDAKANRSFIVLYITGPSAVHPLTYRLNEHGGTIAAGNPGRWQYVEVPVDALVEGNNVLEFSCPEASSEDEGWRILLANAAEFEAGGGEAVLAGETSYKSFDGGETWQKSSFGPEEDQRGEYAVRLSLDRHVSSGTVETPVIDLWRGDSGDVLVPLRGLEELRLAAETDVPPGTQVRYWLRKSIDPDPRSEDWTWYRLLGSGPSLSVALEGEEVFRRYVQVKVELASENPLVTPVLRRLEVEADLNNMTEPVTDLYVTECENPAIRYPSVDWMWADLTRPEFEELRDRTSIEEVVAGCRTQFEKFVRVLDYAAKRFYVDNPGVEYPGWDPLSILDRINKGGAGGMCIQSNNLLMGLAMSLGHHARHVNISNHEVVEVWSDDYARWVYLDAHMTDMYMCDASTGEPVDVLEMHKRLMSSKHGERPIDWMRDPDVIDVEPEDLGLRISELTPPHAGHKMVELTTFARVIPRNNFFEQPAPIPPSHGWTYDWPWNGYLNWYDEMTPPMRQYTWHTDREQDMWPQLNRVHVHSETGLGNDRLFLRFETYTPGFSHYEVKLDGQDWKSNGEHYTWMLRPGPNTFLVRAVTGRGTAGKPSKLVINKLES